MLTRIIQLSLHYKFIVLLFILSIIGFGVYSLTQIPIGAVPDVTNNQVQVITTSRNLSTQDMEQFITYPVELEMANLPGVQEIRSVSKFGLSVVTIVFDDAMGTYLPRQLIAEKIKSASAKIPEGFGTPEMGPISTGLGEIYQYVLDVKKGYEDLYTVTDLRTIQDWVVKRQLAGIEGVVEVNTWGGYLKQYEVALNTKKLNAMNVTAGEVFSAIENNNNVAGGGYIEKNNQAYFIKGEGLITSIDDIGNITVKNIDGLPVYIKDVAQVGYGSATRFGAITGNGEGEKVLGQVMMLKNANSKKVIDAVRARVDEISKTLPEGVYINAFLDRSELIAKTTRTVVENLVLGCLIVIFIVVLLLGNLRSGLVVASVIPLSLLFALSLMYVFGIDANLMSLGAIDFGIIIDGAVIIVEFITFQMTAKGGGQNQLSLHDQQKERDDITQTSASKMMNSAIFGQLIILIVFIPILALSGVEGKMFKPMARTFSFALIGAIVLCFTYVPVVSSLFLRPSKPSERNISKRLMRWLYAKYEPIIDWALGNRRIVLGAAIVLLVLTGLIFNRMGAEFVPTLDEGDFVIQPVLKTGTSIEKTIATTTQIENILINKFPEVDQVVTRIGAAEVPTDPMSMEESDVIITLRPKREWVTARSKDELANKFKKTLEVIPGMEVEFTQPIEMRFNELITGVRADIAVKIFGEDLDILSKKGNEIKSLIENVAGAADVTVEKIVGLPQMNVNYNRSKLARYGLNISELNAMIAMGFAGRNVGFVFEGEKRFDLVVRLDKEHRRDIENLKNLYVDTPNSGKVPLRELADISYRTGAAKISRDNTRRRIVVGINVRDRDLQSVVDEVQAIINKNVRLPVGYSIDYGGQFENLRRAKARLWFAVPIALFLIFVLLYFAFKSVREALLIYSAIPLSAVGGVLLLWIRGMPFSISAGVGFIALFGIAVLNGIVLIEHFKELRKQPFDTMEKLIKQGTKDRLRAVLLTASAAALGFLPMAVSTSAGAEVQRPLATVVIGGLVTATLLTLVVLPILYSMFISKSENSPLVKPGQNITLGAVMLFGLLPTLSSAQEKTLGLTELMTLANENNAGLKAAHLNYERSDALIGSAFRFDKTEIYYHFDENNLTVTEEPLRVFGVQQDFSFPSKYFAEKRRNKARAIKEKNRYDLQKKGLERQMTSDFYSYQFAVQKEAIYKKLDSLYRDFFRMARRRFELGETNYLEKITAQSQQQKIGIALREAIQQTEVARSRLLTGIQLDSLIRIAKVPFEKLKLRSEENVTLPELEWYNSMLEEMRAERRLEQQQLLPDITLNYFQGRAPNLNNTLIGYQLGVKVPLFFNGQSSRIKASKIALQASEAEYRDYSIRLKGERMRLRSQYETQKQALAYFEKEGEMLAREILKTAELSFKNGEIDFFQYLISLENAYELQLDHLEQLHQYNQTVIALNYLAL